jgi:hypothetical protein
MPQNRIARMTAIGRARALPVELAARLTALHHSRSYSFNLILPMLTIRLSASIFVHSHARTRKTIHRCSLFSCASVDCVAILSVIIRLKIQHQRSGRGMVSWAIVAAKHRLERPAGRFLPVRLGTRTNRNADIQAPLVENHGHHCTHNAGRAFPG